MIERRRIFLDTLRTLLISFMMHELIPGFMVTCVHKKISLVFLFFFPVFLLAGVPHYAVGEERGYHTLQIESFPLEKASGRDPVLSGS